MLLASVELHDEAVVTSGNYERFVDNGGRRYHHLLDPRTGVPASQCVSVTVVAAKGALADALATGLFVRGAAGIDSVASLTGVTAMIVNGDRDQTAHFSTGAAARFKTVAGKRQTTPLPLGRQDLGQSRNMLSDRFQ